ncbi:aspartate aminotransferase family protein [Brachyspira hampsonii]|uniref:Acetylornithine aminotransferase n=1 Tax=Brachyspira hampsonii 30446 TaxID=1289135 RepID=A0A2U4EUH1_9SPIR|nr:aspartate aminotransferase family protein [Brachyspira hampsonii]EKV56298.1 acetylornithine and succinylornithine aminotransferase [Brachyspira hampsonii 30446]MBW5390570.1 aspartate aminotransferase family protein [Brachyspira hampsonii]MBW5395568.1 aspartate aminotransferase family protein [Brachyspira hampsonii]
MPCKKTNKQNTENNEKSKLKKEYINNSKKYVANTYARFDLVLESGSGAKLKDIEGKEYIDLGSGIGVNSIGYGNKSWINAVANQLKTLQHTSNLYYTKPYIDLAKKLCTITKYDKVFFCNSGAEANEAAIKCARKYSFDKYANNDKEYKRNKIVTLKNSFHGRTMATLSATGQEVFHNYFFPFLEGFSFAEANNYEDTVSKLKDNACAIMLELIQGEGGVIPLDKEYVQKVHKYCEENDILFIVDEVQTGVGRTGKFLCSEHFGIKPDITTLAKGLGGGLPIGAILMGKKCSDVFNNGDHGSTFGANPIVASSALEVLNIINKDLLKEVSKKSKYIKDKLMKLDNVESVDGIGLMLGIKLKEGLNAKEIVEKCISKGAIPLTAKTKIRLLPPLTITEKELEKAVSILCECIG